MVKEIELLFLLFNIFSPILILLFDVLASIYMLLV